ncbi:DMT family transporter [Carboxylicivirga linearis]|uniref:DMT family transporter n=1 Tax=Carboxylicivirga linearis TaxID=1628157 RepID=A0ABS5JWZ4_9BACT|nr:DMT family transporter [Carboxylicivirga linearis]MBS2099305.1 DMT family transporter [Carboxylicivirga linearis]
MPWNKKWFQFAVLMILAFVWGSSFILMKIGLKSFSSEQAASIRIGSAFLVLLPYSIKNLKHLKKKDLKSLLIAGFIGSLVPAFLFTKAQTHIDSALAGMLNSLTPVFTFIIGLLFFKSTFKNAQLIGIILGLVGASGLITMGSGLQLDTFNSYALLIVLATTCYGVNINEVKARLTHLSGVQITSLSFFFIGPVAIFYLLTTDINQVTQSDGWYIHLGALALLGIMGTAIAMLVMNTLIRYASAVFASSVTYIIPIFAILWGVLDGESISLLHIVFMGVILTGVYMINRLKTKRD